MRYLSGAVAAATPEARQVGEQILASGGNAFDAAVAAAITLAVTEPGNSGLGGEGYCIFYDARTKETGSLCFISVPGARAVPEQLVGADLIRGVNASLVPGAVAGWCALAEQKCSCSLAKLIAPAIQYAVDGFPLPAHLAGALNWLREMFHPSAREIFVRDDQPWQAGDRLCQPDLARTLQQIAAGGAHAFYQSEFAAQLNRFYSETDGILRKGDLADYQPLWQQTFCRRFGELEVHVPPPESTGFAVLYGLELLARLGYAAMTPGGVDALQAIVAVLCEMDRCADSFSARLTPYDPEVEDAIAELFENGTLSKSTDQLKQTLRGSHTTSLSACDSQGNLVCITQTLDHGFGSGVVIPGTGVLMNNGMAWLNRDPNSDRADRMAPFQRYFLPVIPTVSLTTAGEPRFAIGTPGGNSIPQTTLQVYANLLFHGDDLATAVDKPRLTVGAIVPEEGHDQIVHLEPGFTPDVYGAWPPDTDAGYRYYGRFHAVQLMPDDAALAVNDHRVY